MLDLHEAKPMQERGLDILSKHKGGFQFTSTFFPYTSGEIGPYYVQSGVVQHRGDFRIAVKDMARLVQSEYGDSGLTNLVISGGETRDWIFSIGAAFELDTDHVMIYKDGKMVGADIKGKEVGHVADLNNEGSSPRDYWVPIIRKANGTINRIFFYVDRMEEGVDEMEKLGLKRLAVVPLDEHAWDYLQGKGVVDANVYKQLKERGTTKEQRDSWAEKMLLSRVGLETLGCLLASEKTIEKAAKILNKGYPQLKEDLLDRLKKRFGLGIAGGLN